MDDIQYYSSESELKNLRSSSQIYVTFSTLNNNKTFSKKKRTEIYG